MPADSSTRNAPPSPESAPEITTPTYFIVYTRTPSDSAAIGCSPTERNRSPALVRHRNQYEIGTRASAMRVRTATPDVTPLSTPAASEIRNQCCFANQPKRSGLFQPKILPPARTGRLTFG